MCDEQTEVEVTEMKTTRLVSLAFVAAMAAAAQRVPGQYTDSMGGGFNNPISAQMSTMLWNRIFYPKAGGNSGTSGRGAAPSAATRASQPEPNRPADDSAVRFRPTGTYIKTREMADHL